MDRQGWNNVECWMELGHTSSLILGGPVRLYLPPLFFIDISNNHYDQVGAIMLANLAILADVIRVLRTKLRTDQNQVRTIMIMMRMKMTMIRMMILKVDDDSDVMMMFQTRGGNRTLYLWTRQLRAVSCNMY